MRGQEAWFGMALPSSLGSDFVFANVSFLPPGSHELWGRQFKHWGVSISLCGTKEPGKASSVRWHLSPTFKVGFLVVRKAISGTEHGIGESTEMGSHCGAHLGKAGMAQC